MSVYLERRSSLVIFGLGCLPLRPFLDLVAADFAAFGAFDDAGGGGCSISFGLVLRTCNASYASMNL